MAALAATGAPLGAIARAIGFGPDAFRDRLQREPELAAALDIGREQERRELHGALYRQAMKGNIVAGIFLLRARHGYQSDETTEQPSRVNITVAIPAALSVEKYGALIEAQKAT